MVKYLFNIFMIFVGLSSIAMARDEFSPTLIPIQISDMYIPSGFDSNDDVQVVVEGWFPNTCYKLAPQDKNTVKVEGNVIFIQPQAWKYNGACLQVVVHYDQVISLGILNEGDYRVALGGGGGVKPLTIKKATRPEPDDYVYAPIKSAEFLRDKKIVRVEGEFTHGCMKVDRVIQYEPHDQAIAILPIVTHEVTEACEKQPTSFKEDIELTHKDLKGRYLIHIRTANGKSLNLIEDFD